MGLFFIYSLKVALCLVAFYLVYKLLLSRETFFGFNRAVLLGMAAVSLLLPLVHFTVEDAPAAAGGFVVVEDIVMQAVAEDAPAFTVTVAQVCFLIYVAGVAFFLCREVWSLFSLRRMIRGGRHVSTDGGVKVVVVSGDVSPFSWMGNIVISEKDYADSPEYILVHERAHVAARHSVDILLCDLLIVFQWFNPAAWLLKAELQCVHEYEADSRVLSSGVNAADYQLLLIRKAVGDKLFSMANNLNQSSLKKRITMMLKEKSSPWARMKYLYVLPVAAITLTAFARPEISNELNEISTIKVNDITSILDAKEVNNSLTAVDTAQKTVITESTFRSPLPEDSIQSKTPHFFLKTEKVKATSVPLKIGQITLQDSCISTTSEIPVLFIVNGKEVSADSVKIIDPNKIETITILKDKYAITQYGEKGKEGVVSITYTSGSPAKKVTSYKLADGTTVYLKSETSTTGSYTIIHSKDTSSLKTVKLKGEARFKIVEKDSIIEYQVISDTLKYGIQKKKEK